jgi:hypothetical protein
MVLHLGPCVEGDLGEGRGGYERVGEGRQEGETWKARGRGVAWLT